MLESWSMKKLLAIVVLGLLWSQQGYAQTIKYKCTSNNDRFENFTKTIDKKNNVVIDNFTYTYAFFNKEKKNLKSRTRIVKNPISSINDDTIVYKYTNEMKWDYHYEVLGNQRMNKNNPKILKKLIKKYGTPDEPALVYTWKYKEDNSTIKIYVVENDWTTSSKSFCSKVVDIAKKIIPETIAKKPEKQVPRATNVDSSLITIGSGSGFYINNKGYALTNNHVIDICAQSVAVIDGKETLFRVIATDKTNDVAVLKTDYKSRNYIKINEDGAKLGENVIAVGYPLAGRLSDSVKITRGIVSSLSGLDNNIGQIQIDAALQPGNSGGPVLNENGELVGIASAGLNKLLMAKEAKYIPENVNFAVASPIVVNILKSKKVKYTTPSIFSGSYSNTELAELGDSSTIQLFCRNTRTAYNRLKSSNKYSTVLLDLD